MIVEKIVERQDEIATENADSDEAKHNAIADTITNDD
jgi:hypothetical protein